MENHQYEIGDQITNEFLPSGNLSEEIMANGIEIDTLDGVKVKIEENYEEPNFGEYPNNSDLGLKLEEWTKDNVDSKLGIISQTEENFQNFQGDQLLTGEYSSYDQGVKSDVIASYGNDPYFDDFEAKS